MFLLSQLVERLPGRPLERRMAPQLLPSHRQALQAHASLRRQGST